MSKEKVKTINYNICVLGNEIADPLALVVRFTKNVYNPNFVIRQTDSFKAMLTMEDVQYNLKITNMMTPEAREGRDLSVLKKANGIMILYSSYDKNTIGYCRKLFIKTAQNSAHGVGMMFVGTDGGINMKEKPTKEVSLDEAKVLLKAGDVFFMECSAKTGKNVEEAFRKMVCQIIGHDPYEGGCCEIA